MSKKISRWYKEILLILVWVVTMVELGNKEEECLLKRLRKWEEKWKNIKSKAFKYA